MWRNVALVDREAGLEILESLDKKDGYSKKKIIINCTSPTLILIISFALSSLCCLCVWSIFSSRKSLALHHLPAWFWSCDGRTTLWSHFQVRRTSQNLLLSDYIIHSALLPSKNMYRYISMTVSLLMIVMSLQVHAACKFKNSSNYHGKPEKID